MWLRLIPSMGRSPRQSIQNITRVAVLRSRSVRVRVCQTMNALGGVAQGERQRVS